ncbi:MAG: co-chaperone GroES [Patescibacteria group bacterium]
MNFKPLSNRVLIELTSEEQKTTPSGIVLPDTVEKKEQTKGVVIATGPGKVNEKGERTPLDVKVGDKVVFNKPWSDDKKIKEGDKEYFLVEEDDILAVIN